MHLNSSTLPSQGKQIINLLLGVDKMKSATEIKQIVEKARNIVNEIYKDDVRLKQAKPSPNSGITRETDIVFKEILRYMLNA
jgi:hypothetical protein